MKGKLIKLSLILAGAATVLMAQGADILGGKGDFESSSNPLSGWGLELNGTEGGDSGKAVRNIDSTSGTAKKGKSFLRIKVEKVTDQNWHVQMKDPSWTAKKDYTYYFSMWARSDSSRQIQISVNGDSASIYTWRASSDYLDLTTEWQQFKMAFTSDVAGSGKLNFSIVLGFSTGIFDIDDIVITEEENTSASLYANGGFEADGAGWTLYKYEDSEAQATATYPSEGAKSGSKFCRIAVTEKEEDWHVQLQDGSWTVESGREYTYSFWAKADKEVQIQVVVQAGSSREYAVLDGEYFDLSTEWKEHSFTFLAEDIAGKDSVSFNIYLGADVGEYDFDDISLTVEPVSVRPSLAASREKLPHFTVRPLPGQLKCIFNGNRYVNKIAIHDVQGRLFYSRVLDRNLESSYSLPRPPSGIWVIRVNSGKLEQQQKIVLP